MGNLKTILDESANLLTKQPFDDAHDLSHHERVWENAQKIAGQIPEKLNRDALHVAVMWHDVMVGDEKLLNKRHKNIGLILNRLQLLMSENGFDSNFQKIVTEAIKHHEFGSKKQVNIEGKVLFDADKLDALNPTRYRKIINAIKSKKISKLQTFLYVQAAKLWLRTMRSRYHFEISKQMHDKLVAQLLQDKEAIDLGNELGVDIAKLAR